MSAKDLDDNDVVVNDVIQIEPTHRLFPCCLAVVTKAAGWGVQCDVYSHSKEVYPTRLAGNQFVRIGTAKWLFNEGD